ncbi:hypothetical protein QV13_00885 [Mesorhizobium hungaricum]|jgi:hypothetical protein|uniref:Uncharacterized protein n=1 Tax=Mesorhizobium hungaricum TaxID=1566387 RepID=A0A1C2EDZ3_9HYPH|nr:hypothetical protein QV13_00885 [Mesorhizobium hungaricum]
MLRLPPDQPLAHSFLVSFRLNGLGYTPINGSADAFAARLKAELVKWRDVARAASIKIVN